MKPARLLPLLVIAALAACTDRSPTAPDPGGRLAAPATSPVTAMTRNLYVGTDVFPVFEALGTPDPGDDLPALLAAIAEVQNTSFPARSTALADEIEKARPHVVGLQEVTEIDVDLTGLGLPVDFDFDYLAILQAELASRGLDYQPAAAVVAVSVALPGVTVVDRDVILVDADRATWDPASVTSQTFAANLGMVAPGLVLNRGWVSLDVTVDGSTTTVASTHLEAGDQPGLAGLRAAQAAELVAFLGAASPAILMGDLNDLPGSPMYQVVTGAGFVDAWAAMRPAVAGLTCCHRPDLSNRVATGELDQRIDYVLARGFGHANGALIGRVGIVGSTPGDRVQGPAYRIWPSDHAGLFADLLRPPAFGTR